MKSQDGRQNECASIAPAGHHVVQNEENPHKEVVNAVSAESALE